MRTISADITDAHAGGDVGRVLQAGAGGLRPVPGDSVAEKARFLRERADGLRQFFLSPPRGSREHSINLVVETNRPEADFGLIVMGTMGYPNFSGTNAMCALTALISSGQLSIEDGRRDVVVETPGGLTRLYVHGDANEVTQVSYDALPGFVLPGTRYASVEGRLVPYQLVYGGTFYAVVNAEDAGLDPATTAPATINDLLGKIVEQARAATDLIHPTLGPQQRLTLALLAGQPRMISSRAQDVTIAVYMRGGVICRSPTGTGSTALAVWLLDRGDIDLGTTLRVRSPYGHAFTATATMAAEVGQLPGSRIRISGGAYLLSRGKLIIDPADPATPADILNLFAGTR